MLDEIEEEELNPMNIVVDPRLGKRAQEESYQIQNQNILDRIDEKRYGPEGKPKFESIEEFHFCNEGVHGKNVQKMEAKIWDLER